MNEVALPIALAVLRVAAVALVGYILARRNVLHPSALGDLSALVIKVTAGLRRPVPWLHWQAAR